MPRRLTWLRVVLCQLIIVALLVLFIARFTVGPLRGDPYCMRSHGRLSLYLENDAKAGNTVQYHFDLICDEYRPAAPDQTTYPDPGKGAPWSP